MLETIEKLGVIPVVVIEEEEKAPPLAQALLAGGLPCAEVTFRTAAAEGAIRRIADQFPELLLGAGTVLTVEQAQKAVSAGARFIVTPGFDEAVVDFCLINQVPVFPGVVTPTEINMALNKGLHVLKFFPAEVSGGVKMLKAVSGPYTGVRFMPTGGISAENLKEYLALPQVIACGGSWLVNKQLIAEGQFDQITQLTKEAVALVRQVRIERI